MDTVRIINYVRARMHTMSALVASMDIMHRLYDLVSASFGKEVLLNNVCVHLTHAPAMSGTCQEQQKLAPPATA